MGRMCDGKVRYPTEEAAIRCLLRRSREVGKLRYYKCPICKGYHLTSKELRTEATRKPKVYYDIIAGKKRFYVAEEKNGRMERLSGCFQTEKEAEAALKYFGKLNTK